MNDLNDPEFILFRFRQLESICPRTALLSTPTAFRPLAQGCTPKAGYPGTDCNKTNLYRNAVASMLPASGRNPVGVEQVVSFPTPG
jgi:hypothetical protein